MSAISSTASAEGCVRCRLTKSSRAVPLSACGRRNTSRTDSPNWIRLPSRSRPISRTGRPSTRTSRNGFDQVSLAVAADAGVAARQVAQDRHVGRARRVRLANRDLVAQANPISAHGVDPQHEPVGMSVADTSSDSAQEYVGDTNHGNRDDGLVASG